MRAQKWQVRTNRLEETLELRKKTSNDTTQSKLLQMHVHHQKWSRPLKRKHLAYQSDPTRPRQITLKANLTTTVLT